MQAGLSQTQDVLLTGMGATQDVLGKSAQRASKGLKEAQKNIKVTQNPIQSRFERRARNRKRARMVFRLGLLSGFAMVLLYTPWPGSEIRHQLVELWNGLFQSQEL